MSRPTLRFAPSPNGRLHLGHAYSALLNERVAGDLGGVWLLRMENIDPVRATSENIRGVLEDLAWLRLSWPEPVRRQSEHMPLYRDAANRLKAGGLLYRCFCSRGDIAAAVAANKAASGLPCARDPDGSPLYPGTCRALPPDAADARARSGAPHAWRLDMAVALAGSGRLSWRSFDPGSLGETRVAAQPELWGDPVMVRKDVPTSYHLSVVVDDAAQGITHVVRGRDLLHATDLHALLAAHLGIDLPRHHHHDLIRGPDGDKLSKSRGSDTLASLREAGVTPFQVKERLGFA